MINQIPFALHGKSSLRFTINCSTRQIGELNYPGCRIRRPALICTLFRTLGRSVLYDQLIRQSVLSVKVEQVASFLGWVVTSRHDWFKRLARSSHPDRGHVREASLRQVLDQDVRQKMCHFLGTSSRKKVRIAALKSVNVA
jgi:hypothetical protein